MCACLKPGFDVACRTLCMAPCASVGFVDQAKLNGLGSVLCTFISWRFFFLENGGYNLWIMRRICVTIELGFL